MSENEIKEYYQSISKNEKWGYLRENTKSANKDGIDIETGLHRTGLEEYLKVIYPSTNDWILNKTIKGSGLRTRPDYRSESLKIIIEFDGTLHYKDPRNIYNDMIKTQNYISKGYKVIHIPYFIQLTNDAIKELFGVDVKETMFNPIFPSLGPYDKNTPAFLCYEGIKRMAKEFKKFPDQYKINVDYLKSYKDKDYLIRVDLLEKFYNEEND